MPDANLNFQITGDASQFRAALNQAQTASRQTAEGMTTAFTRATEKVATSVRDLGRGIGGVFEQVARNIGQAATQWGDQWAGTAQGAFNSVSSAARGMISAVAGIFGGATARMADIALNLFALPFENALDHASRAAARFLRDIPSASTASAGTGMSYFEANLAVLRRAVRSMMGLSGGLGDRPQAFEFEQAMAGINPAGTSQSPMERMDPLRMTELGRTFGPAVANLTGQAQLEERAAAVVGQTAGAIARARAELELWRALWLQGDREPNADQVAAMEAILNRIANAADARQSNQDRQQVLAQIRREIEMERERADAINLTAGARARERSEAIVRGFRQGRGGRGANLLEDDEVQAALARREAAADAAAHTRLAAEMGQAVQFQTMAFDRQRQSIGATAGEMARLLFVEQQHQAAIRAGVLLSDDEAEAINRNAEAIAQRTQALTLANEQFRRLLDTGRVVASSLESAFAKFMDGTKQSWRSLVNDLSKDMAKLAFRQLFINTLFGQGAGSSNPLGLFGQVFGGFRAEGGSVSAGTSYMVGERGPELFRPRQSGTIVPNSAMRGGDPAVINMRIDLSGANGDETIARISGQAARMAAMAAVQESNAAFPARQRRLQMLGT
jgi:hypothetical protein